MFSKSCRRKLTTCIWLTFGCAYLQPIIVQAEPIQIKNFGFEDIELIPAHWTRLPGSWDSFGGRELDDPIPHWTVTNRHPSMFCGTRRISKSDKRHTFAPEGNNAAYAYDADIAQELDAVLESNTRYTLQVDVEHRATAERVHELHAHSCPVARSIGGSVAITTELAFQAPGL